MTGNSLSLVAQQKIEEWRPMKALIVMDEARCGWLRGVIQNNHPGMMPFCNKPLLEYLLDFSILCGCEQLRFVMDEPGDEIEDYFDNGSKWGITISYASSRASDTLEDILEKNSTFCDEPTLIIDGFCFIGYSKNEDYDSLSDHRPEEPQLRCGSGQMLIHQHGEPLRVLHGLAESRLEVLPLEAIGDCYDISMHILDSTSGEYVLPGYNNEAGVFIGRNVTISKSTTITKPVMLGNNVQLQENTVIGPGAIIGSNVIVDTGTSIEKSIIINNSYVGTELKIKKKIIHSTVAISAETGTSIRFVDDHLLSGLKQCAPRKMPRLIVHWVLACLFFVSGIIPALLFQLLLKKRETHTILRHNGKSLSIASLQLSSNSLVEQLARIFLVDKVMLLPHVLSGRLDLVGNKPFPATPDGEKQYADFNNYLPGIFSFSESQSIEEGDFQEEIAERYFSANRRFWGDLQVIIKTFTTRW